MFLVDFFMFKLASCFKRKMVIIALTFLRTIPKFGQPQ